MRPIRIAVGCALVMISLAGCTGTGGKKVELGPAEQARAQERYETLVSAQKNAR